MGHGRTVRLVVLHLRDGEKDLDQDGHWTKPTTLYHPHCETVKTSSRSSPEILEGETYIFRSTVRDFFEPGLMIYYFVVYLFLPVYHFKSLRYTLFIHRRRTSRVGSGGVYLVFLTGLFEMIVRITFMTLIII